MPSMCDVCDEKIQGRGGKLERKLRKFNKGGQKFFFKLENWQLKISGKRGWERRKNDSMQRTPQEQKNPMCVNDSFDLRLGIV